MHDNHRDPPHIRRWRSRERAQSTPLAARPPWPRNSDSDMDQHASELRDGAVFQQPAAPYGPSYGHGITEPSEPWHPPARRPLKPKAGVSLRPFKLDLKPRQPSVGDVVRLKLDPRAYLYATHHAQVCVVMGVELWNSYDPTADPVIRQVLLRPMATPWETWALNDDPRGMLEWV